MKTLASSSSLFTSITFFSSLKFHPTIHPLVSFPLNKLHSLHFISVQRFHLHPISSSSPPPPPPLSPESQTDLELAETFTPEKYESETVHIKFQLKKECSFGEQFAIVGDDLNLGLWNPDNAIPLNWSDDHVWNLELDVPIGKSIQFKFILKEITGSIVWQPGPDRILNTWETNNTIVVYEDWEDATSQKLLEEEEPFSNENVDPADSSEMRFIAENLMQPNASDIYKENIIPDVESNLEKEPLPSIVVIADTAASSEEEAISIVTVADNISNSNEETAVNANHQVFKDESDKDEITFEKILENNTRTRAVPTNSESTNVEENLMIGEGDPVLVPGLPQVPVDYSKTEVDDEEAKSMSAFDASVGVNEVENHDWQEKCISIELEEKHDVDESEKVEVFSDMEQQVEKDIVEEENEIQWGRRTIQRLLTNLGLLYQ
ncbi:uncharacterized protein [Euphorbia lathyris]|uniref:uncharacterized protein n=1 Tax=Euphorbia lathyris TaxID=212925 RepID=UPI0033135734